jgi:hypothetical protein
MAELTPMLDETIGRLLARRAELEFLVAELERINCALDAAGVAGADSTTRTAAAGGRQRGARRGRPRARRGANQAKILRVLGEGPRRLAEIAEIARIRRTVVATTVNTLLKRGAVRRTHSVRDAPIALERPARPRPGGYTQPA